MYIDIDIYIDMYIRHNMYIYIYIYIIQWPFWDLQRMEGIFLGFIFEFLRLFLNEWATLTSSSHLCVVCGPIGMGWLRLVGSFKL